MITLTHNTKRALLHLKTLAPTDGWSIERRANSEVRLLRRSVPLTDNYFLDLYVEPAGRTVGILSSSGRSQVLVDASGTPSGRVLQLISCPSYARDSTASAAASQTNRMTSRGSSTTENLETPSNTLSDDENKKLILYAAYAIGTAIALRLFLQTVFYVYILAFPMVYLFGVQSCPSDESFDAKQQLKRVMRGHHLPDDHPDKPKGVFQSTMAKWSATLTTELSTALGYEVSLYHLFGACTVASVTVPSVSRTFVWVGFAHRWRYVYCQELERDNQDI